MINETQVWCAWCGECLRSEFRAGQGDGDAAVQVTHTICFECSSEAMAKLDESEVYAS